MPENDNYILIQGWMVNDLELKGNELLAYAMIYGFSQDEESEYRGSLSYLQKWLNVSRQTAINTLNSLLEKGLIEKKSFDINNVHFCTYRSIRRVVKKLDGGSQNFRPNNKEDNKEIKKEIYKERKFSIPTVEEVGNYCNERKNGIDPQYFWDFYNAKGWKIGKETMKDWKSAVRTWEARQNQKKPSKNSEEERDYSCIHL